MSWRFGVAVLIAASIGCALTAMLLPHLNDTGAVLLLIAQLACLVLVGRWLQRIRRR